MKKKDKSAKAAKAIERLKELAKKHPLRDDVLNLQKSEDLRRFRAKKLIGLLSGKIGDIDAKEIAKERLERQAKKAETGE